MADKAAIAVAECSAPHGVRGALRCRLYDPSSTALRPGLRVELRPQTGPAGHALASMSCEIVTVEPIPGRSSVRVVFRGVDDRDRAESLRGYQVWVDRDDLPPLDDDEFYLEDIIGFPVEREREGGRVQRLGTVVGVTSNGAQDLLEVEWLRPDGRKDTWLLPALPQFLADIADGRVRVELPIGLLPDPLEDAP